MIHRLHKPRLRLIQITGGLASGNLRDPVAMSVKNDLPVWAISGSPPKAACLKSGAGKRGGEPYLAPCRELETSELRCLRTELSGNPRIQNPHHVLLADGLAIVRSEAVQRTEALLSFAYPDRGTPELPGLWQLMLPHSRYCVDVGKPR